MAALNELIDRIQDPELQASIRAEVSKLTKRKKFGLVFEDHIPECTPLYDIPVRVGSLVARKSDSIKNYLSVISVEGENAVCQSRDEEEPIRIPKEELVTIARFGDPIYPYLKHIDSVCNAPDSDLWHTLIEADNYHALQLLEYLYAGKVDCIYIDPPYNLGGDFVYNDNFVGKDDQFRHSKWLSFMNRRLRIARRLLSPSGIILISINENEYAHLKLLCDEIFSEVNYQATLIWKNRQVADSRNKNMISTDHEYILAYGKTEKASFVGEKKDISKYSNPDNDPRGPWASTNLSGLADATRRPNLHFTITNPETGIEYPPNPNRGWSKSRDTIAKMIEEKRILWPKSPTGRPREKKFLQDLLSEQTGFSSVLKSEDVGYTTDGTKALNSIFDGKAFNFPKSVKLIKTLIAQFPDKNCLVLDFFAGSGTTLHAVNLLNAEDGGKRRCIMVTNNEVSDEESKKLKKQGFKPGDHEWEQHGIARFVTWPRSVCSIKGQDTNGNALKGKHSGSKILMSDGFKANAAFFKLGFLDKTSVRMGRQFREMLPVLWMKAGCHGSCPDIDKEDVPDMLVLAQNHMAVLNDNTAYPEFLDKVKQDPRIKTVFLVTDSDTDYRTMANGLNGVISFQLYRDYLDNFRINSRR